MRSAWSKLKSILGRGRGLLLRRGATSMLVPVPNPVTVSRRAAVTASSRSNRFWRQLTNPRRLTILFWVYLAQALAGSVVGFTAPFLYYFGFL
jgi:hypothetical protein